MLEIIEKNRVLVVNSRLIATELGVTVKSFHENIRRHQAKIESEFGQLIAATQVVEMDNGGYRDINRIVVIRYWLNKEQLYYLMSLSRSPEKVTRLKAKLSQIEPSF